MFICKIAFQSMSNKEREDIFKSFIQSGWKYIGSSNLANTNYFDKYLWDKESEPIYPPNISV